MQSGKFGERYLLADFCWMTEVKGVPAGHPHLHLVYLKMGGYARLYIYIRHHGWRGAAIRRGGAVTLSRHDRVIWRGNRF